MKKIIVMFMTVVMAGTASARIIGVNGYSANANDGWDGGAGQITGAETFGVTALGTVQTNWNNSQSGNTSGLIWNDGAASTVNLSSYTTPNGKYTTWAAPLANTAWRGGIDVYSSSQTVTMTANNLNANFAQGYYVIAYMTGTAAGQGSITDGATTYYFDMNQSGVEDLVTSTTSSAYEDGNYVVFGSEVAALTADSFSVSVTGNSGTAGIGGFQIVAIPEPSTIGLVAAMGGGLLFIRRRFMM